VRSKLGRRYDGSDFCPEHNPAEANERAAQPAGTEN
jgi:hypothetical protein